MKASILLVSFILICFVIIIVIQFVSKNNNNNNNKNKNKKILKNYKKLFINENIKELKDTTQKYYIPTTTSSNIKMKLDRISKVVLLSVNKPNLYNFYNTGYDDVLIKTDLNNNKHYIYDMFVYDKINNYDLKLRIDLIHYNEGKIDNKLIPGPMEIISVPNQFLVESNKKKENNLSEIHINSINIVNSSLYTNKLDLINTSNTENIKIDINENSDYKKLNNTSNHYSNVGEIIANPYIQKSKIRNQWPDLNVKSSLIINVKKDWNEWGIPDGNNKIRFIQAMASDNPTVNKEFGNKGDYNFMFRKTNASGAVSSSDSQPAP